MGSVSGVSTVSFRTLFQCHRCTLKRFVQIEEKALAAKPPEGIVERKVCACNLVEQYPQASSIPRLKYLEQADALFVISALQVTKHHAAHKFIV